MALSSIQVLIALLLVITIRISTTTIAHSNSSFIRNLPGFPADLPFKLETGYVGVGEKEDAQLFYYFIESERNPKTDPLILWIPGGPGCSVLRALIYELGPFYFDYEIAPEKKPRLQLNPYSWTKVASILFLDSPVGTGFSYGKTSEAYKTSDSSSSKLVYDFLKKWLNDHPKFMSNPLYVGGVSYSGIFVPIVTQEIYNGNEEGNEPHVNIKGYMVGNPLSDREIDSNARVTFAHRLALLSDQLFESVEKNCLGQYTNVNPANNLCINDLNEVDKCLKNIYTFHILEPNCGLVIQGVRSLVQSDRKVSKTNVVTPLHLPTLKHQHCRWETEPYYTIWANDEAVQKALHVREGTIKEWKACSDIAYHQFANGENETTTYAYDVASSVPYHRNLTNKNCRALIFSGDHDMVWPYVGTEKWIKTLQLSIEDNWSPWLVENEVAGYRTRYSHNTYSMTFATVKGAGHVAPLYKRKESLAMVEKWLSHIPL